MDSSSKEPKANDPETFYGKPDKLRQFIQQCNLVFRLQPWGTSRPPPRGGVPSGNAPFGKSPKGAGTPEMAEIAALGN